MRLQPDDGVDAGAGAGAAVGHELHDVACECLARLTCLPVQLLLLPNHLPSQLKLHLLQRLPAIVCIVKHFFYVTVFLSLVLFCTTITGTGIIFYFLIS